MSGNNLDSGIRANEAVLSSNQQTPAEAKSSDALLFRDYLSGGQQLPGSEIDDPSPSNLTPANYQGKAPADAVTITEARVSFFIESGQSEFPSSATAEDRHNAFMFSDTIRYNFETETVQVLAETHLGVPGWQNLGDVSPELAAQVTSEVNGLINERVSGPLPANTETSSEHYGPVMTSASTNSSQQPDAGGTITAAGNTQGPPGVNGGVPDTGTSDGSLIPVGNLETQGPSVNLENQTIMSPTVDANGNEVVIVSDPATGVSTVIDPKTGDVIAGLHVDPVNGATSWTDENGELMINSDGQPLDSPFVQSQTHPDPGSLFPEGINGNPAASAVQVLTEEGDVILTVITTGEPDGPLTEMFVFDPDGNLLLSGVPIPHGPFVPGPDGPFIPQAPVNNQIPPSDNSQGNPDTGSGGTPPPSMTTDDAFEHQQVELPADFSTDAAWEEVNQQTDQDPVTTDTQTTNQGGSGSGSRNGSSSSGGSPASAGSMGTGNSPTGSDIQGTPF